MTVRLAADIGGTFTDLVLLDEDGNLHVHKTPSTPRDFTEGILLGVERIVADQGLEPGLAAVDTFVHGATVVLNALLQLQLPKTGLITTSGFRDVLEIMRTNNPWMYDLSYIKPAPVVPRHLRLEVRERVRHTGEVVESMHEEDVLSAARRLAEEDVEAIGVCLLHAYANPVHEQRIAELLERALPGRTVCLSSDVAPEWREFERTSTTCVNAATTPIITSYLSRLGAQLADRGLQRDLLVMQSNGGVMTAGAATRWPVRTVMSGPSGGVVGALALAEELGNPNVVTIDIGGTSSDMGLIAQGRAVTVVESSVGEGWPILAPMIEILSIGAGGGSIAWLDAGGALRVGPQSAGADPAPVSYGRGGVEPTVTDANVTLGRIDPDFFLGGEMSLDVDGARAALKRKVADQIGLSLEAAADGILRIVNANMAKAMRSILIERGHDPREFVLMAFGGGGGLHAAALMRELNVPHAIVPNNPGALSATGMLGTDFRQDRARTMVRPIHALDAGEVDRTFRELEDAAAAALVAEGLSATGVELQRSVDLRYLGQEYHLNIPYPDRSDDELTGEELVTAFNEAHSRVYGYSTPEFEVQLVGLRVVAIGRTERRPSPTIGRRGSDDQPTVAAVRPVYFTDEGWADTAIYTVDAVLAGDVLEGPAILEDPRSTMLVLPGQHAVIDEFRHLHIHESAR